MPFLSRLFLTAILVGVATFCTLAQVTSNFSLNDDGWTIFNTSSGVSTAPVYSSTGGNPATGGFIADPGTTVGPTIFYAEAPSKFRGNLSLAYKQTFTFDLKQSTAGIDNTNGDLIIASSTTGLTLFYQLPTKPATASFSSYSVQLSETFAGWHVNSLAGAAPTQMQVKQVLLNITSIRIRLKYTTSNTFNVSGSLDNVVLNLAPLPISPVITSFTPASGLPGTTVAITGNNFNTNLAQNVVYFNGVKGTVTNATATQLTVTSSSKISNGPITVINLSNGAQGVSRLNFNPLFDNNKDFGGRVIPSTFAKFVAFGLSPISGLGFTGFSSGDLDGDGWTDILTTDNVGAPNLVSVFRNLQQVGTVSASSFAAPVSLSIPSAPLVGAALRVGQSSIADMDSDGKLDIIINVGYNFGGNWDNSFVIFLNQSTPGSLSFSSGSIFQYATIQNNNQAMTIVDIDGDGRPELLGALGNSACHLGIAQNLSTPGNLDFAQIQDFSLGQTMGVEIASGDLTGDGKPELITISYGASTAYVYENTSVPGSISLGTPFQITSVASAEIKIADLDKDGINDIVFADNNGFGPSSIHIKKNNHTTGALTIADFSSDILLSSLYPTSGYYGTYMKLADVNGDNRVDIVTGDGTNMLVYQNNYSSGAISASSFAQGIGFEGGNSGSYGRYTICADIDGDNKPEVLMRPQTGATFYIYHNESFPAPQINAISPSTGNVGTSISLTGTSFNTYYNTPQIRVAGVVTTASDLSNTVVTSKIPPGISNSNVQVTLHGLSGYGKTLTQTFNGNQIINSSSFSSGVDLPLANNGGLGLAVADFDNDGKPDIVADDNQTGRVFQNVASTGATIEPSSFNLSGSTLTNSLRLVSGDFDGDGKIDLVTGYNLIYQNNSTSQPSFLAGVSVNTNNTNLMITDHDFNLDGKQDILSIAPGSNTQVSVFENHTREGAFTPTGTPFSSFTAPGSGLLTINVAGTSPSITASDFDGDGFDDFALGVTNTPSSLTVYRNSGLLLPITASQFASPITFSANSSPSEIVSADFDVDGKIDVAIGYATATLSIFKNQSTVGAISFAPKQDLSAIANITAIAAQDLDGDGKPEIITTNFTGGVGSFSVYKNTSSGSISFAAPVTFNLTSGRNPTNLFAADMNLDGQADLIIRGTGSTVNFLSIFQNNITPISITITTQPSDFLACVGETATFQATGIGTTNITYQWQYSTDGVVFNDIVNNVNYSGVTTQTLSVFTVGSFGAGRYRCKISGDLAVSVFTNDEGLFVNALPAAPATIGDSKCPPATFTLTASGGASGEYRWYTTATGGTAIAGQASNIYVTPSIVTTTSFYVSINNGSCESSRTEVIATVLSSGCTNTPPVINTVSLSTPQAGMVVLDLVPLIIAPGKLDINSIQLITQPNSGATFKIVNGILTIDYAGLNFSGSETITIQACDVIGLCAQQIFTIEVTEGLTIYNAVSANGDKLNEIFKIKGIEQMPDTRKNTVTIFNRWGSKVFEVDNYDNTTKVFKGLNNNGNELPSGTYFYKIFFPSTGKSETGYLVLKR